MRPSYVKIGTNITFRKGYQCYFVPHIGLHHTICFQIAIAYRFHIRGLNMHMASIHGDGIGLQFFSIVIYKMFWSRLS
jgi:hypothetical protein